MQDRPIATDWYYAINAGGREIVQWGNVWGVYVRGATSYTRWSRFSMCDIFVWIRMIWVSSQPQAILSQVLA